jgi:hypothetical protein
MRDALPEAVEEQKWKKPSNPEACRLGRRTG